MLIWFLNALYFLGHGIVAQELPEYTADHWPYGNHQTNDRYWANGPHPYGTRDYREIRPPENVLTAERGRSWQAVLQLEQRNGARGIVQSGFGLVVPAIVFWVHWRIARRARREDRDWVPPTAS